MALTDVVVLFCVSDVLLLASEELFSSYDAESARLGVKVSIYKPMQMHSGIRLRLYPGEDKEKLNTPRMEAIKLTKKLLV